MDGGPPPPEINGDATADEAAAAYVTGEDPDPVLAPPFPPTPRGVGGVVSAPPFPPTPRREGGVVSRGSPLLLPRGWPRRRVCGVDTRDGDDMALK